MFKSIRNRLRPASFTLVLIMFFNVAFPTVSWALTAGPTAPEATSFEPVDTEDMVNLSSGDLAYNIPLLEVPGPAGGYPLSLSYHAGIQPNEDASWVGLGWTLNPGAIIRNVNGYADDQKNATDFNRFFWEGGVTKTFDVSVNGAYGAPGSLSFGLSYSQDTFQGSGVGLNAQTELLGATASAQIDTRGNFGIGLRANIISRGIPVGSGTSLAISATKSIGISAGSAGTKGFNSTSFDISSINEENELNSLASISTRQSGTVLNLGYFGVQLSRNSRAGRISNSSSGLTIPIPTPVPGLSISLGFNVQRYWIDEVENTTINGALYFPTTGVDKDYLDNHAYDVYSLKDPLDKTYFLKDPDRSLGGTLPGYDNYNVHAQGIGGSFRPYLYQKYLFRKNKYDVQPDDSKKYQSINYVMGNDPKPVEFRFINDFSNRHEYNPPNITQTGSPSNPLAFSFSGLPITGENGQEAFTQNNLPGSRQIVWLTNAEIMNPVSSKRLQSGFMDPVVTGFDRSQLNADLIGGYVITNESGVKYHFALPAMSSKEYFYSENTEQVLTFNEFKKDAPYAYTWYLTAVTGPDYVDRGPSGFADGVMNAYDWGYWVQFEYGKWTDQYAWRNPGAGMDVDLDSKFKSFSEGIKELYYLDAIRTATHTALFIKDIRNDAKSSLRFLRSIIGNKEQLNPLSKQGGYIPKSATATCLFGSVSYIARPTSTLKLTKVLLVDNKELISYNINKTKGDQYGLSFTYNWEGGCNMPPVALNQHLYQNVLDVNDENFYFSSLESKALRVIKLETDYSLTPETPNSYATALTQLPVPNPNEDAYALTGKLTLKGVKFLGKGGADLIPGLSFNYELDNPVKFSAVLASEPGERKYSFMLASSSLHEGDLIRALDFYAVIVDINATGKHSMRIIGKNMPQAGVNYSWTTTKNPPYGKDHYDIWNNYKSDFITFQKNENLQRLPSAVSSKSVDAWSLRSVRTSLGSTIKIEYEPDSYDQSVFHKNFSLPLTFSVEQDPNITPPEPDTPMPNPVVFLKSYVNQDTDIKYSQIYSVGDVVDLAAMYGTCSAVSGGALTCNYNMVWNGVVESVTSGFVKIRTSITHLNGQTGSSFNNYYGGQLFFGSSLLNYGGGVRVKDVGVLDNLVNKESHTVYEYLNGVTSYEPVKMDQYTLNTEDTEVLSEFAYQINLSISNLVALGNFIPPPGVMYGKIRVREKVLQDGVETFVPNYSEYEFETVDAQTVQIARQITSPTAVSPPVNFSESMTYNQLQTRNITIKDFTTRLGSLRRITLFDDEENKITETINHYLFEESNPDAALLSYNNQGLIEETFAETFYARRYHLTFGDLDDFSLNGMITKKEEYPTIQLGQTSINYKTGVRITNTNRAFDFYSGQVTKTLSTDGFGNAYLTEIIPAYRKYPEMGQGANGKNMLSQEAGRSTFKVDAANTNTKIGLVAASVQTWSKNVPVEILGSQNIYRQKSTYTWKGDDLPVATDGLYPSASFVPFDGWTTGNPSSVQWQKNGEITLYDPHSHALEARDINGNYAATKMSSDQVLVFASAANASYNEFAYSGAEDIVGANGAYGGGVLRKDGLEVFQANSSDKTTTHTGKKSLRLTAPGTKAFQYSLNAKANRTYRASVWTNHADGKLKYSVNGVVQTVGTNVLNGGVTVPNKKAGSWNLVNLDIPIGTTNVALVVWCETTGAACNFDDFRVHPVDGPMSSYVYNEWRELSHTLDNNNLYTEYRYDLMGRLSNTYREALNPGYGVAGVSTVSEIKYNYATNEFTVPITASYTGNTGNISPAGIINVPQNGTYHFTLNELCATANLLNLKIDNLPIALSIQPVLLFDGTSVSRNGQTVTFQNLQAPHSLDAEYATGIISAGVICHKITVPTGGGGTMECPTGKLSYFRTDACGVQTWVHDLTAAQIPPDLQGMIPSDCCNNAPVGCSCNNSQQ